MAVIKGHSRPAVVKSVSLVQGSPTPAPTAAPAPATGTSKTLPMPAAGSTPATKGDGKAKSI